MSDIDHITRWLLQDPYLRINNGHRYFNQPDSCMYDLIKNNEQHVLEIIRNSGYQIKILYDHTSERDAQGYTHHNYIQIESELYPEDLWCNLSIGRTVSSIDKGKFIKRCDVGQKLVNDKWVYCTDLMEPGQFARIIEIQNNRIYILYQRKDIADISELENPNILTCFRNDEGFLFLN